MEAQIIDQLINIIEKEKKTTTYKFALLRAVIEIVIDDSLVLSKKGSKVEIPMGLVVEKWILYYYNIGSAALEIPQIKGAATKLAFYEYLIPLINYYQSNGGREQLQKDLNTHCIPEVIAETFFKLCISIDKTIVSNPVKRFGSSVGKEMTTTIFTTTKSKWEQGSQLNRRWLIEQQRSLIIDLDYYQAFRAFGREPKYMDNLLHHWALFSRESNKELTIDYILQVLK